jgi:hypothetical protein
MTWQMIGGVNTFRPTDGVDDRIEAWGSFTGLPEVTHTPGFGLGTNRNMGRRRGCHRGVLQSKCMFR